MNANTSTNTKANRKMNANGLSQFTNVIEGAGLGFSIWIRVGTYSFFECSTGKNYMVNMLW